MELHNIAFVVAGLIGSGIGLVHGSLLQNMVVRPLGATLLADGSMDLVLRKLLPILLHFTTFNWLLSGVLLLAAAFWFGPEARLVAGLYSGSSYLFGAVGAFSAIRGLHPSWMLLGLAFVMIVFGLMGGA